MAFMITRRSFLAAAGLTGAAALCGCSAANSGSAESATPSASGGDERSLPAVTIGTLATEDILPFWVAEEQGWFNTFGLTADIVEFQSATELIAGVGSGDVDFAMTDIMVAASMFASGIDVQVEWITLGTTPEQGRFGIMVGPRSEVQSLEQLAGVPIGVGSNTILEYVMDRLMEQAGVPADQVVVEEIQKLPVRYQAMVSGEVAAAALPNSLLVLGEANGCRILASDTTGENISQSIMIMNKGFMEKPQAAEALKALKEVWNEAVTGINEDSEAFRSVLVENAGFSSEIAEVYPISDYPVCELPTNAMVDPVLSWMEGKGYLTQPITYNQETGEFSRS